MFSATPCCDKSEDVFIRASRCEAEAPCDNAFHAVSFTHLRFFVNKSSIAAVAFIILTAHLMAHIIPFPTIRFRTISQHLENINLGKSVAMKRQRSIQG